MEPRPDQVHKTRRKKQRTTQTVIDELIKHTKGPLPLGLKAYKAPCTCGTSMLMLAAPAQHCPACHSSWTFRGGKSSDICPRCHYNLKAWRLRLSIPEFEPGTGPMGTQPAPQQSDLSLSA